VRANSTQGYKEAYLPIIFPSSHAANLLQLKNGDLLCVWFSGVWEGDSGVGIVLSRKPKGSDVWTKPQLIDKKDGESYQNPVVFEDSEGKIHIFHTTQGAGAGEANSKVLEVTSNDHGFTWSTPKVLFEKGGSFTRHPLLVLQDGTWLLPMTYVTSKGIGEGAETNYSAMKLSHDRGRTWTECVVQDSLARVQPTVVDVGSNLVSFFRDRASDWIYRSTSSDGCHWSKPEPTVLPNNNASVQSFRLKNGHFVMVFDNSHADRSGSKPVQGLRKPLSIALSVDEGKSWSFVRDIEQGRPGYGAEEQRPKTPGREEYSYPTVMQTDDGKVHVAFTFRRQTIKEVELTEDWIRQGATVGVYKAK
jgi:predicted neuraminidase